MPSRVAAKLAKCTVLMAPGGRAALVKRPATMPGGKVASTKRSIEVKKTTTKASGIEWATVVAPAWIQGSPMHQSPIAYNSMHPSHTAHNSCGPPPHASSPHNTYISIAPIGDAPPQAARLIDRRLTNHSVTTRSIRRPLGKTSTAWVRYLPAVCDVNCTCTHPSMLAAVHTSTDEYIVPTSVDYHKMPHRSPPGSQASTSGPSSPIHSALVGGGQPVCDLLPVTQSHIRHPSDVPIAVACMYRLT